MPKFSALIEERHSGIRPDAVVAELTAETETPLSRSSLKSQNLEAHINGKPEKWSYKVRTGDTIEIEIPEVKISEVHPQDLAFDILYSDEYLAVVNKPWGMPVHPSKGHEDGTLVNGLLHRLGGKLSSIGGVERPGIVHRLDMDTAGIMVVALTDEAHRKLAADFKDRKVEKYYHAVVKGRTDPEGRIDAPIGRSTTDRKKMAVRLEGKPAVTEYKALEFLKDHTYLEIHLLTGRTHQIRVHFAQFGHPVAGDPIYSRNAGSYNLPGIALCSKRLAFQHPVTGKRMEFEIDLPEEMRKLIARLKK